MALKEYCDVPSDKFKPEQDNRFCFPCSACEYRYHPSNGKPCNECGHNATADMGKFVRQSDR